MSEKLLQEIVDELRASLPDDTNLHDWIIAADRFQALLPEQKEITLYHWGRLRGAAEWAGYTVLELLDDYEIPLFTDVEDPEPCTLYSTLCPRHDFVHGAEAEELRKGIEELMIEELRQEQPEDISIIALQRLLDTVDARDSLAYREAQEPECGPDCRGWSHANLGEDCEGIERCVDCGKYATGAEATRAHANHCDCLAGVVMRIGLCHGCGEKIPEGAVLTTIKNDRAYCTYECASVSCQDCSRPMREVYDAGVHRFHCDHCQGQK